MYAWARTVYIGLRCGTPALLVASHLVAAQVDGPMDSPSAAANTSQLLGMVVLTMCAAANLNCASVPFPAPDVRVRLFGDVDLARDKVLAKKVDAAVEAAAISKKDATYDSDVRVLDGSIPEGIVLSEQGSQITVAKSHAGRYRVIGSVKAKVVWPENYWLRNVYWTTADYQSIWRKALCWPQAPLKAVTIGLWNIVPTSWPCWMTTEFRDETQRTAMLIHGLTIGTSEIGGNLLLITARGATTITTVNAQTGQQLGQTTTPATAMSGFAIEVNDDASSESPADSKPAPTRI